MRKKKKKTVFTDEQIAEAKTIYNNWQSSDTTLYANIPEICQSATLDEIRSNNYSLAPSKYIEFINHDTQLDVVSLMEEIKKEIKTSMEYERETLSLLERAAKEIEE